jgi:hypothetical protein
MDVGSIRAELQNWRVDLDLKAAKCERSRSYRQALPRAEGVRIEPLARELAGAYPAGVMIRGQCGSYLRGYDNRNRNFGKPLLYVTLTSSPSSLKSPNAYDLPMRGSKFICCETDSTNTDWPDVFEDERHMAIVLAEWIYAYAR